MRLLARLGQLRESDSSAPERQQFELQFSEIPERARIALRRALASLAAETPTNAPDEPVLLKLAEHMAIRFALDRFERGEVRVNAVREMLERMGQEIRNLRKILGAHEEKMSRAGMLVESRADVLDRQFWTAVPETGKRMVLSSREAWCVPPRNVRNFLEELLGRGETQLAQEILQNYVTCIANQDAQARRKTAAGLSELAELYAIGDGRLLLEAIRQVGVQLTIERDAELESLISAAFVRLSQEAAKRHRYPALIQALASFDGIENQRPAFARSLRPRIGVEDRLPEFLEEAIRAEHIPHGLPELLRLMPRLAVNHLVVRFSRSTNRADSNRVMELAHALGTEGASHLREVLRAGPNPEAIETVGLLSRLEPSAVEQFLPDRIRLFERLSQDRVVRQIASGGAPERSRLLLALAEKLDAMILSVAVDEIGMLGDLLAVPWLVELAEGHLPEMATPYLRIKAVEALGRLRATDAAPVLCKIVEARQTFRWAQPSELRVAAAQALQKVDPNWARGFLPHSGLTPEDFSMAALDPLPDAAWKRQRRYPRFRLARPFPAVTTNLKENCRLEIKIMSLGGGTATSERHLSPGTLLALKLNPGLRPLRAQVIVRHARTQVIAFEVVDIDLEDRSKLRRLLLELKGSTVEASAGAPANPTTAAG